MRDPLFGKTELSDAVSNPSTKHISQRCLQTSHNARQTCRDIAAVLITTLLCYARNRDSELSASTIYVCPPSSMHRHEILTTLLVMDARSMKEPSGRHAESDTRKIIKT
jgi:hypothetical protein